MCLHMSHQSQRLLIAQQALVMGEQHGPAYRLSLRCLKCIYSGCITITFHATSVALRFDAWVVNARAAPELVIGKPVCHTHETDPLQKRSAVARRLYYSDLLF